MTKSRESFKKRKKELARKEKKELKRQRKLNKKIIKSEANPNQSQNDGENI
jgi:glucose-6-phosphate-specific signal transduction histidine kinase